MAGNQYVNIENVPPIVHLCVGGERFVTKRSTLAQDKDNLLGKMFGLAEVELTKVKETESVYFFDRDPKHFQRILNYLRDGKCVIPSGDDDRKELLAEAEYYEMHKLVQKLRTLIDYGVSDLHFNFRGRVLQYFVVPPRQDTSRLPEEAETAPAELPQARAEESQTEACLRVLLTLIATELVSMTPLTEVSEENRLTIYWLTDPQKSNEEPRKVVWRYRGEKESNDVGQVVEYPHEEFLIWGQLYEFYVSNKKQRLEALKAMARKQGLKITFLKKSTNEKDAPDYRWQHWKRHHSLTLGISACDPA